MKKRILTILFYCLTLSLFGQANLENLIKRIKSLDNSWKLEIDTSKKAKIATLYGGQNIGYIILTKAKEEITFCVYKSTNKNIENSIKQTQKLASCGVIGLTEKNQIAKQNNLVIFLSIYPCWTTYSENSRKLINNIFTELKTKLPK
jgi:hypothetical protein